MEVLVKSALCLALAASACTTFEVAEPGVADAGGRTIASSSEPIIDIPDDNELGVTDAIEITSTCAIDAIEIDIAIRHTWRGDVSVHLTSPSGTSIVLKEVVLEDDADDVVGTYPTTLLPVESLATLGGENGRGQWVLTVADHDSDHAGAFNTWGLRLTCQ